MFVGRISELSSLQPLLTAPFGSAMIYGKRKVGKTTLITHALETCPDRTVYYECIRSTLEDNLEGFVTVLVRKKILPMPLTFRSFPDVFAYLNTLSGTLNIVIDEYPYLKEYARPETVDSLFQSIIDNSVNGKNLRLFLSGSHIGMMKDMLEEKNALYGRFTVTLHLKELNYREAAQFYPNKSVYDKVAFYSVFGGSPFINGLIDPEKDCRQNIIRTILNPSSPVYNYAEHLLISDYSNAIGAERIFYAVANGRKKYGEIEEKLGLKANGTLSKQLSQLLDMEILSKVYPINKPDDRKKLVYEINDNLLRFYYSFVYRNKSALQMLGADAFYDEYIEESLVTFIAHRFEEQCRSYFSLMAKAGKLKGITDIGTFYYDDSETKTSGEFDVVLQRRNIYDIYEVKYYRTPLERKVMTQEERQVRRIKGLQVGQIGFISVSGFAEKPDIYRCIDGWELY